MSDTERLEDAHKHIKEYVTYNKEGDTELGRKLLTVLGEMVEVLRHSRDDLSEIISRTEANERELMRVAQQVARNEKALKGDEWTGSRGLLASQKAVTDTLVLIQDDLNLLKHDLREVRGSQVRAGWIQIATGVALIITISVIVWLIVSGGSVP